MLHHIADLPVHEVAREIGAPEGTVKARLSRGRAALAALLVRKEPPMPDLDDLDDFDQGLPAMTPLPPTEVRRRGDRMRRRNTALAVGGGVLAAAVAIGTPVIALDGRGGGERHPAGAQSLADDSQRAWVTEIPADFPLDDGFPFAPGRDLNSRPDPNLTPVCGGWELQASVISTIRYEGESEDRAQRTLVLFPDADTARAKLELLRSHLKDCAPIPGGPGSGLEQVYEAIDVQLGTEESYAFSEQTEHDDGLRSDLTLVHVARTGNALYFDSSHGSAGGEQVVRDESARLLTKSQAVLEAMCVFAADPCADRPSESSIVLGPEGVGALRLGMTPEEVEATGEATSTQGSAHDGWGPGCEVLDFEPGRYDEEDPSDQNGRVSPDQGLEQIRATADMTTPEGIGIGSTIPEVLAAYAELGEVNPYELVTVQASAAAVYRIQFDAAVSSMSLELRGQDCEI